MYHSWSCSRIQNHITELEYLWCCFDPKSPLLSSGKPPLGQFRGQASHSRTLQQFVVLRQHVWDSGYRSSTVWSHKDVIGHADKASINIHITTNGRILIAIQSAINHLPLNMYVCMWDMTYFLDLSNSFIKTKRREFWRYLIFFTSVDSAP